MQQQTTGWVHLAIHSQLIEHLCYGNNYGNLEEEAKIMKKGILPAPIELTSQGRRQTSKQAVTLTTECDTVNVTGKYWLVLDFKNHMVYYLDIGDLHWTLRKFIPSS